MLRSETSDDFLSYRVHNYSEFESDNVTGWTVSDGFIKLIQLEDGTQELYRVDSDLSEVENLINEVDYSTDIQRLTNIGNSIRGVSDNPTINLTNQNLVNRNANCKSYAESYFSDVMDVNNSRAFNGQLSIEVNGDKCIFNTNAIPNHDFNDGGDSFPNDVTAQDDTFQITASPRFANETSPLSLRVDNALLLNGVKVDLLAAACFGVGDEKTGCNDDSTPWRFDPMHPPNNFRVDSHNAHAQPDGTYHYHGTPNALYVDGNNDQASPVLGFAADGFPIYGPYIDDNGLIRKALPSYQLRSGDRPDGNGNPGGAYDGTYRDDYEFVSGSGDLDECNGMMVDGSYGYYITDDYPYILACFKGTPDTSFNK